MQRHEYNALAEWNNRKGQPLGIIEHNSHRMNLKLNEILSQILEIIEDESVITIKNNFAIIQDYQVLYNSKDFTYYLFESLGKECIIDMNHKDLYINQ